MEHLNRIPHYGRSPENVVASLQKSIVLNLSPRLSLNNAHFMKKCALADMGIIQLHDCMVKEELKSGTLVEVLADFLNDKIPLYIYYQKHKFVQPKIRHFVNLCGSLSVQQRRSSRANDRYTHISNEWAQKWPSEEVWIVRKEIL